MASRSASTPLPKRDDNDGLLTNTTKTELSELEIEKICSLVYFFEKNDNFTWDLVNNWLVDASAVLSMANYPITGDTKAELCLLMMKLIKDEHQDFILKC